MAPILSPEDIKEIANFEIELEQYQIDNNILGDLCFELTHKCNLDCIHCFQSDHDNTIELSFEDVKKVIEDTIPKGLYKVTLTGGECTLNSDFLKIAGYVRSKKLRLSIITNGQKLYDDPEMLNELISLYPYKISLSLYGMKPETHEKITRVKGSYNKTFSVINKLNANNIFVGIKYFILPENFYELKDVIKFGEDNNICVEYSAHLLNNFDNNNEKLHLTEEQFYELYTNKDSAVYVGEQHNQKITEKFLNSPVCKGGIVALTIYPNGDVSFCPSFKMVIGNIKRKSIIEVWQGEKNKEYKSKKIKDLKKCFKKEYCNFCTYCPGFAISEGNYMGKSKLLCKMAKVCKKAYDNLKKGENYEKVSGFKINML